MNDRALQRLRKRLHLQCIRFHDGSVIGQDPVFLRFDIAQLRIDRAAKSVRNCGQNSFPIQLHNALTVSFDIFEEPVPVFLARAFGKAPLQTQDFTLSFLSEYTLSEEAPRNIQDTTVTNI